jgi:hypothetical protein
VLRVLENEKCVPGEAEENMVIIDRDSWTRYSSGTVICQRAIAGIQSMQEFKQICR